MTKHGNPKEDKNSNDSTYWQVDPSGKQFVNPYNFVRLGRLSAESESLGVSRSTCQGDEGALSGVIECTLHTRTPLAMPDVEGLPTDQQRGEEHKGAGLPKGVPFFRVPRRMPNGSIMPWPAIPGSEIRGAIRSAFEALDNGCLSVANDNVTSARSNTPFKPAILEGRWVPGEGGAHKWEGILYEAKTDDKKPSDERSIRRVWPKFNSQELSERYFKQGSAKDIQPEELTLAVKDYLVVVDSYMKNSDFHKNQRKLLSLVPRPPKNPNASSTPGKWPVFYCIAGNESSSYTLYLSPTQMTRKVFRHRVSDLIGGNAETSFSHCTNPNFACEPCRLFGFVGSGGARASHIRFTDAWLETEIVFGRVPQLVSGQTLKELSSPKPSAVEFYTKRPMEGDKPASSWTYDAATFNAGEYEKLVSEDTPMQILGRKFYVHHYAGGSKENIDQAIMRSATTDEATKRNMTTELAKSGSDFSFKVFFEGINQEQLDKLIWTLCIGENNPNGNQLHKIGHGKPLGLGSVKITVDKVLCREADNGAIPHSLEELPVAEAPLASWPDSAVVSDYLAITNWRLTEGCTVCYPLADDCSKRENSKASHQWFLGNRFMGEDATNNMQKTDIKRGLPPLPSFRDSMQTRPDGKVLLLPKLVKKASSPEKGRGGNAPVREQRFQPVYTTLTEFEVEDNRDKKPSTRTNGNRFDGKPNQRKKSYDPSKAFSEDPDYNTIDGPLAAAFKKAMQEKEGKSSKR